MLQIETFTFNPFQENTYIVYNSSGDCLIIDPGCYSDSEEQELAGFIAKKGLKPAKLLNTHGHVDHVFGNAFVHETFGIAPWIHDLDREMMGKLEQIAGMYGLEAKASPQPAGSLKEGDTIKLGDQELEILFTPGHSPGSVIFLHREQGFAIAGDVLFYESIGRSDLPGGDHETLLQSIRTKLLPLGDHFEIYSGHGPVTTIGHERLHNPFIN